MSAFGLLGSGILGFRVEFVWPPIQRKRLIPWKFPPLVDIRNPA